MNPSRRKRWKWIKRTSLLLILLGGLALNFTPCVLPMIPVNLAIIGAGVKAGSKARGFLLGGCYGLGMTLVYGALGLVVVLSGKTFGSLNASPWFNGIMALIFLVLAVAMFDVIPINFSRWQGRLKLGRQAGMLAAFSMGAVAALLAGACVAPVVISVLVWSQSLYSQGITAGLLLPFLLGLGMALPWPFAGAGLSFLPKPGRWMIWVRNGFGLLILLLAFYYGKEALSLFKKDAVPLSRAGMSQQAVHGTIEQEKLEAGLERAWQQQRRVVIDFRADWCKNCVAYSIRCNIC